MNLKKEIAARFGPFLEQQGFLRSPGPWLSYARKGPTIHYHVDVENAHYISEFSVTLQTVDKDRCRNAVDLADLAGGPRYRYPSNSTTVEDLSAIISEEHVEEVIRVIEGAFGHLRSYGIPWLERIGPPRQQ